MRHRGSPVGGIVGAVMTLFVIALAGSILTFVIYALAALAALGLGVMLVGWVGEKISWRQAAKHSVSVAAYELGMTHDAMDDQPAARVPPVPEDLRHPAWAEAVEMRTNARRALIEKYLRLAERYEGYSPAQLRVMGEDGLADAIRDVRAACFRMFGTLPRRTGTIAMHGGQLRMPVYNVAVEPVPAEVLHLDRSFRLVADCRYGHAEEHHIVGIVGISGAGLDKACADQPRGHIVRECVTCKPATHWTERP